MLIYSEKNKHFRYKKRYSFVTHDKLFRFDLTVVKSPNDNERTYKYQQIKKAIPQLSEDFRNIIILRDIQELSYDEISNITGLAIGTVKSRINRARLKLIEMVNEK